EGHAIERRLRLPGEGTGIVERFLESPAGLVGHLACRGRQGGNQTKIVERGRSDGSENLAGLANRAAEELGRLADLHVLHSGALELRVGGHEDGGEPVVQIARKAAPMFLIL